MHPQKLRRKMREAQEHGPNFPDYVEDLRDGALDADEQHLRVLRDWYAGMQGMQWRKLESGSTTALAIGCIGQIAQ